MSRFAVIAALFLGAAAVGGSNVATADEAAAPQVSPKIAKQLKAAQDAVQAKSYADAVSKLKELQSAPGRAAYDDYVINALLMQSYAGLGDNANTAIAAEAIAASSYTPTENRIKIYDSLAGSAYNGKSYDKAIEYAEKARSMGETSEAIALMIAQSYYLGGRYKEAAAAIVALNEKAQAAGRKPTENSLKILWDCARQAKDDALAAKTVEQLILLYPNATYWQYAMQTALDRLTDDRVKVMTYRLALKVGVLDQGNSGEAQAIMEQAFTKNLFTDAREKDSNQRLLEAVKKKAGSDRATIANDEKQAATLPAGDGLVQVGAAYLGFGDAEKAISAINAGITKGNLKYPDESYLILGIAQEKAKNNADAIKAFEKVSKDPRYVRLAKLWILEVRS
jgi:tetratricopeptide (TPR) repeat protein